MRDATADAMGLDDDPTDPEVDALNEALPQGQRGFYARHMNGDVMWHEAPDRERCGGHGWMSCHCGGDLCVCGNGGEIECMGCEDCEHDYNENDPDTDDGGDHA
jgi:hypothetical protein